MYLKIKKTAHKLGKVVMIAVAAMFIAGAANAQDKMKIAVMDFKAGVGVEQGDVDGVSAIFSTYFNDHTKYILVERTQIDRVISEQGFQYSSLTNQQMVRIGQILNISRMVVGDVNIVAGQYNIDVRVVNAETGAVEFTDGETWVKGSSYRELMRKLAGRLLAKMSYTTATPSDNANTPPKSNTVVTLYGYLQVFPDDLGEFPSTPATVIAMINKDAPHGYNDWRIPTLEELALIRANNSKIGLKNGDYMTSDGTRSGNVRLVTTGKTVAEKEAEEEKLKKEKEAEEEKLKNLQESYVEINGVKWTLVNVGATSIYDAGTEVTGNDFRSACLYGWRLPTLAEFESLLQIKQSVINTKDIRGVYFGASGIEVPLNELRDDILFFPFGYYWSSDSKGKRHSDYAYFGKQNYDFELTGLYVSEARVNTTTKSWAVESYGDYCRCVRNRPTAAELKAKEAAEQKAKEAAEQKAKEEAAIKAEEQRIAAERKAKEDAEKLVAEQKVKEEAARKAEEERLAAENATLTVSPTSIEFDASGGSKTIVITTNMALYSNTSLPDWISSINTHRDHLTITCSANTATTEKSSYFTIMAGNKTVRVDIKQKGLIIQKTARIDSVWQEHNVYENSIKGMKIHIKFGVHNMLNLKGNCVVWFYLKDGTELKDSNGRYRTSNGQVANNKDYTPSYKYSAYNDFVIFMPYSELHCASNVRTELKFYVGIFDDDNKNMVTSNYYGFNYGSNK
jgi:hypothetical protein